MMRTASLLFYGCGCLLAVIARGATAIETCDVAIYGATSSGVIAAVQAARMGKSVVLLEPGRHMGGMTTGGLGATDTGRVEAIGGLAREFYERIARKYDDDRYWTHQSRDQYIPPGPASRAADRRVMWTFEPKVAAEVFADMMREQGIAVRFRERLVPKIGVTREGGRIVELVLESGARIRAKMFIDASYEGDLMAWAGVAYTVGRESTQAYGESLNGISTKYTYRHERKDEIDAYVIVGDPASGLLPTVEARRMTEGAADPGIMASCFRMCLTNQPSNRLPIEKPAAYQEQHYELLLRSIEAGRTDKFFNLLTMPNGKTDSNCTEPFSTNFVGMNHGYPDGDYAAREKIVTAHRNYQLGFLWTLQHHPRVPELVRQTMLAWGLPKDEFAEHGNWPPQLYIREGRRMIGELVMLQQHCEKLRPVAEPIGLGSYTMDSHYVSRFADERGKVRHEGNFDRHVSPYGIGYRALVPKADQCRNLLVSVCLSASHVAYGSIRMEPVFMILGQSAATAACLAIDADTSVQQLPYARLRDRLVADKQVLEF